MAFGYTWVSQDYTDERQKPVRQILEDFADDHDAWARVFLEAWQRMQETGYTSGQLNDAPENSWMGYYKLEEMGANVGKKLLWNLE